MHVLGVLEDIGGNNDVSLWHIHFIAPISIDEFNASFLVRLLNAFTCVYIDQAYLFGRLLLKSF